MLKAIVTSAVLAAASLVAAPSALACDGEHGAAQTAAAAPKPEVRMLTVDQLAAKLDSAQKTRAALAIYDANSTETRSKKGIIPTAILLPSSSQYDLALLPSNKSTDVVFYCAAEKCGASKTAAKKALSAGYTNVHVLPAGIAGWVGAGRPTEQVAAAAEAKPLQG